VAWFEIQSLHLPAGSWRKLWKPYSLVRFQAEIWSQILVNMKLEHSSHNCDIQFISY
jgi:hypothetical protein